jgi:protein SCO1
MKYLSFVVTLFLIISCQNEPKKLPILGDREAVEKNVDGKIVVDTAYHSISDFKFVSQYGDTITQDFVRGKIYLVDFFFTSCPTICPRVKKNMLKVYESIKNDPNVVILSHTIDPRRDDVATIKNYADKLHLNGKQWLFLTGDRDALYKSAGEYLIAAQEEETAEGGFTHSGNVMLIDENRHIRGFYNGMEEAQMTGDLLRDLAILKNEK